MTGEVEERKGEPDRDEQNLDKHSSFADRTHLSANAFKIRTPSRS